MFSSFLFFLPLFQSVSWLTYFVSSPMCSFFKSEKPCLHLRGWVSVGCNLPPVMLGKGRLCSLAEPWVLCLLVWGLPVSLIRGYHWHKPASPTWAFELVATIQGKLLFIKGEVWHEGQWRQDGPTGVLWMWFHSPDGFPPLHQPHLFSIFLGNS